MEYITLDFQPMIDGIPNSSFINVLDITGNTCNVTISNNEATIHSVAIINSDIQTSVSEYFKNIS